MFDNTHNMKIKWVANGHCNFKLQCHYFSLGLATKARVRCEPKVQRGSHIHTPESARECEGMSPHTPKWELDSQWTPKFSESHSKGQTLLDWELFYTIGIFLRPRCLKWGYIIHLSTYNTSFGQMKGWE